MKKTVSAVLVILAALLPFHVGAEDFSRYTSRPCDSCIIGFRDKSAFCQSIKTGKYFVYGFDRSVAGVGMKGDKLYALVGSNQNDMHYLKIMSDGKVEKSVRIFNLIIRRNCPVEIDKSGNVFIIRALGSIAEYGCDGILKNEFEGEYKYLFSLGGTIYAADNSAIYRIEDAAEKITERTPNTFLSKASDSYIAGSDGFVYNVNDKTKLKARKSSAFTETESFILAASGESINAYDKLSGRLTGSLELDFVPFALYSEGKSVYAVEPTTYCPRKLFESDFVKVAHSRKVSEAEPEKSSESTEASTDLSEFEISGKYIFFSTALKRPELREKLGLDSSKLKFSARQGLPTDTVMTFSDGRELTIIKYGDLKGTDKINGTDIKLMLDGLLGLQQLSEPQSLAADLNTDGKLTNADLVLMARLADNEK